MATHPNKSITEWGHSSTAAGAYGVVKGTYDDAVKRGIAHDFGDRSQDAIALSLIQAKGALSSIWDGNLNAAFAMLNTTRSSLPGGSQQEITIGDAKAYFQDRLDEAGR